MDEEDLTAQRQVRTGLLHGLRSYLDDNDDDDDVCDDDSYDDDDDDDDDDGKDDDYDDDRDVMIGITIFTTDTFSGLLFIDLDL